MKKIWLLMLILPPLGWSAQITVDSDEFDASNNGNCNFAEAVLSAGFDFAFDQCVQGSGDDVIVFDPVLFPGPLNTMILNSESTLVVFGDSLDIQVPSGKGLTIISDGNQSIFDVNLEPNSTFTLNRTILREASSTTSGGAIQFDEDVDVINFTEVTFINNHSDEYGGAIGFDRPHNSTNATTINLLDCQFIGNTATHGGAIFADKLIDVVISQSDFYNNIATDFGGALRVFEDLTIDSTDFNNNQAQYGGGIYSTGGVADIRNSLFEGNSALTHGGAVYKSNLETVTTTDLEFRRNSVLNNTADSGAGLFVESNQLIFINNLVANNVASSGVGGLMNSLDGTTDGNHIVRIIGNTFYHNRSEGGGGGVADISSHFSDNVTTYMGNAVVSDISNNNTVTKCNFTRVHNHETKHNLSSDDADCLIGSDNQMLTDPMALFEAQVGFHPYKLVPQVNSPLIDAWSRTDCFDQSNELLDFDLSGRRNHSGLLDIYNGDGDDQGHCDIGSAEIPDAVIVSVSQDGPGAGRIYGNPESAINCLGPAICDQAIVIGEQITLNTNAYSGSQFVEWGHDGFNCGTSETCVMTVPDGPLFVSAYFEEIPTFALTINKSGNGDGLVYSSSKAINCGQTCSANIEENELVILDVTPDNGDVFSGWSGDCIGMGGTCVLVMDEDHNVTAHFNDQDLIFASNFDDQ